MPMAETQHNPKTGAFRVEAARPADAGVLASLIRELAVFEHLENECRMDEATAARHLIGPGRHAEALLAWRDGEPLGFAVYFKTYSTFAARPGLYLEDLFVRPAHRGLGVGKALLCSVGRLALEAGCGRFEWTTLEWNENARNFYARIGARERREWILLRMEAPSLSVFAGGGATGNTETRNA